MTYEEAIDLLKHATIMDYKIDDSPLPLACAVVKAIEALEKQKSNSTRSRGTKPIPFDLSSWGCRTEVLYKCANCGADFRILSMQEKYCHNCGKKQNWGSLPKRCSLDFMSEYFKYDEEYIDYEQVKRHKTELLFKLYKGEMR